MKKILLVCSLLLSALLFSACGQAPGSEYSDAVLSCVKSQSSYLAGDNAASITAEPIQTAYCFAVPTAPVTEAEQTIAAEYADFSYVYAVPIYFRFSTDPFPRMVYEGVGITADGTASLCSPPSALASAHLDLNLFADVTVETVKLKD